MISPLKVFFVLMLALQFQACGGGGSADVTSNNPEPAQEARTSFGASQFGSAKFSE